MRFLLTLRSIVKIFKYDFQESYINQVDLKKIKIDNVVPIRRAFMIKIIFKSEFYQQMKDAITIPLQGN